MDLAFCEREDELFVVAGKDEAFEGRFIPFDLADAADGELEPFFVAEGVAAQGGAAEEELVFGEGGLGLEFAGLEVVVVVVVVSVIGVFTVVIVVVFCVIVVRLCILRISKAT